MMQFTTDRLEIKPMTLKDKEEILDLLTDATVAKTYMLPAFQSREEAQPLFLRLVELCRKEDRYAAGVYLEGKFIGMMNETERKDGMIEMGYAYLPAYYNRGYATEAFRAAIAYLLSQGFSRVLAGAFEENAASLRVMEKCGMVRQDYTDQIEYRSKTYTCIYYAASARQ